MNTDECLFCKIIAGDVPSEKIYEDADVFAFLDIHPVNKGHTLVIPKKHADNIYTMSTTDFGSLMERVQKLSATIKHSTGADGINIGMNNDEAAGQVIFHAHIHIIPRFLGDGHVHWEKVTYEEGEINEIKEKIIASMPE